MAEHQDPFETLKRQEDRLEPPLPAAEVRARGDRMRRRRTAFRAVAAAAAVAVVTTGGIALGGQLSGAPAPAPATEGPRPTPPSSTTQATGTPSPRTEIPADFPIAANIAVTGTPPDAALAERLEYCGERPLVAASPVDALSAESSGGETSETRTLLLFGDERAAVAAAAALLQSAADCPQEVTNVVGEVSVLPRSEDWPGRTIRTVYGPSDAKFVHLVQAGPALLLAQSYRRSDPEEGLGRSREDLQPLLAAMSQFGALGPAGDLPVESAPPTPLPVDIPAQFPLDLGFPEARFAETSRVGPEPGYQPIDHIEVCGEVGFPTEDWVDLLGASFEQPEDVRHRMLTTYPDAETAHAVVAHLVDTYRACPRQTDDLGWTRVTDLREVEPGEEGYVAIQGSELDAAPAPGLGLTYVVRVGNAVLLHATSNEGGGNERQIYAQVQEQTRLVAQLAEEMCLFSAEGCP